MRKKIGLGIIVGVCHRTAFISPGAKEAAVGNRKENTGNGGVHGTFHGL